MSLIKIGIIGCADIAQRQILPALLNLKKNILFLELQVEQKDRALELSSKFNIPYYMDYQNLIIKKDLDAVYIPLPNSMHFEWVKKSLLKGYMF